MSMADTSGLSKKVINFERLNPTTMKRKTLRSILILLTLLLFEIVAFAEQDAVQKYRNYTPQQIKNLPEKIIHSEVPMMYNYAANTGMTDGSELVFAMQLNRLMYPGIHDYNKAIKLFQSDLGDVPSGVLTVWQIHNLQQRSDMQGLRRVLFPDQFSSFMNDESANVQGTMIIIDDKIMWPINHVNLNCYKIQKYCELDRINIDVPNNNAWSQNYQVLEENTLIYNVSRWDQDSIDAEYAAKNASSCRTTSLNLNFKTKEFYLITRNAGGNCEILGVKLDKLSKPRISQIVDGSNILIQEFSKIEKAAYDVLSSDFRKRIDKFVPLVNNK